MVLNLINGEIVLARQSSAFMQATVFCTITFFLFPGPNVTFMISL